MELTLESALSSGGMIGHLSYFLLVLSMLMRRMTLLRLFAIGSALVGITYSIAILRDPVGAFWESLLITVNVGQLTLMHWSNVRARFNDAEVAFVDAKFPGLSKGKSRQLLDRGTWIEAPDGMVLTEEGRPSGALSYIAQGMVDIVARGVKVSECGTGDFIGEMTVLNNQPATARTIVRGGAQVWQISSRELREMVDRHPEIGREIDAAFARNYREKLIQSNHLIAKGIVP